MTGPGRRGATTSRAWYRIVTKIPWPDVQVAKDGSYTDVTRLWRRAKDKKGRTEPASRSKAIANFNEFHSDRDGGFLSPWWDAAEVWIEHRDDPECNHWTRLDPHPTPEPPP